MIKANDKKKNYTRRYYKGNDNRGQKVRRYANEEKEMYRYLAYNV